MERLQYKGDCRIERNHPDYPASAVLVNCEGDVVRRFDEELTDAQIFIALDFANYAFNKGFEWGKWKKLSEIKKALDIA